MRQTMRRLLQTIRFERDPVVWMDFDDRATGDAFILVAVTRFLLFLGLIGFGGFRDLLNFAFVELLIRFMIQGLVFWLLYSAIVWAIQRFLFQRDGNYQVILRLAGFAYPTVLVTIAAVQLLSPNSTTGFTMANAIGSLWFVAIIAKGMDYIADLDLAKGSLAAVGGWVGYVVINAILNGLPI